MRTRQSICRKKTKFLSRRHAGEAAEEWDLLLLPYRCDRCLMFHLTSRTKGKRLPRIKD